MSIPIKEFWYFIAIVAFISNTIAFLLVKFNDLRHLKIDVEKNSKKLDKVEEKTNSIDKLLVAHIAVSKERFKKITK